MTPQDFIKYHTTRPHIYEKFKTRAIELINQGANYLSARGIFYDLRSVNAFRKDKDDKYKIMNEASKYYVDLFEIEHPQHKGKFKRVGSRFDLIWQEEATRHTKQQFEKLCSDELRLIKCLLN